MPIITVVQATLRYVAISDMSLLSAIRIRHAALLLFGILAGLAFAQKEPLPADDLRSPEDYVLRTWEMDEGLPTDRVTGIAQTPDGFLWLATWNGLVRFDGVRFVTFTKGIASGLPTSHVQTVLAASNGALWAGLDNGIVVRRTGDRFETILPPGSRKAMFSLVEDKTGSIWFAIDPEQKVFRWRAGDLTTFVKDDGVGPGPDCAFQVDTSGTVWFATRTTCSTFDGRRFGRIDLAGGAGVRIAPARIGGMWAVRGTQLLRYRADGRREEIAELPMRDAAEVTTLHEDRVGNLWLGTERGGLLRFRDGTFTQVAADVAVFAIFEDREGNLWLGTNRGLTRVRPRRFFLHQKQPGAGEDGVVSLCQDPSGRLWLAGRRGTLFRARDATNRAFDLQPQPSGRVLTLCADAQGRIWIGTLNLGMARWENGTFAREALNEPITAFLADRRGDLWAATIAGGLIRWHDGVATYEPDQRRLVQPRALAEDRHGRLWVGTEAGQVYRREPGGDFALVPLAAADPNERIRFIVAADADTVWIGAGENGLYRWRAGSLAKLPADAGIPDGDLQVLAIDAGGDFWFGADGRLFRVAPAEIESAIDHGRRMRNVIAYGREDGLPNLDFPEGFRNTTTRTPDGHLWFATYRGALELNPSDRQEAIGPAAVLIEEIRVGGRELPGSRVGAFTLPPRPEPLEIRYTLPQLSAPQDLRFRYRLVGLNDNWVPVGNQRTALFTHLPPANYRFEVSACARDGDWLPPVSLAFTVSAAWWETVWFKLAAGLLGALAFALTIRLLVKRRLHARLRATEQAYALERERMRLARDLHDEVGACLTRIAFQAELVAATDSQELADSARAAIDALDEVVWAANPRNDTLASLLQYLVRFTEDFLKPTGVRLRVDFPAEVPHQPLPPEFRHQVLLVVKEALNNAVKHSGAGEICLTATLTVETLAIVVSDDGRGFEGAPRTTDQDGLNNLRTRAEALQGECRIESRPGLGTRVTLSAPWPAPVRNQAHD